MGLIHAIVIQAGANNNITGSNLAVRLLFPADGNVQVEALDTDGSGAL